MQGLLGGGGGWWQQRAVVLGQIDHAAHGVVGMEVTFQCIITISVELMMEWEI